MTERDFISEQPPEVLFKICDYLDKRSLEAFVCTNVRTHKILKNYLVLTAKQQHVLRSMHNEFNTPGNLYIRLNTGTGTGKTFITLHFINQLAQKGKKSLIITKNVLRYIWIDEVKKYNVPGRCINLKLLEKPPARKSLQQKMEHLSKQLENEKVVLLAKTPVWTLPYLKVKLDQVKWHQSNDDNEKYVPQSVLFEHWNKIKPDHCTVNSKSLNEQQLHRLKEKQLFLDTIFKEYKWDLVVYDDIKPGPELKRLLQFNPQLKCLLLEAKYEIEKGVVGKYQSDVDLGHIPKIKVDFVSHYTAKASSITSLSNSLFITNFSNPTTIEDPTDIYVKVLLNLINSNAQSKVLIALSGMGKQHTLPKAIKVIRAMKLKDVYFLGSNGVSTLRKFKTLKFGILIGGWASLAKGHNIFPEKVYLIEDEACSILSDNGIYQLIGRLKRVGSPYKQCYFTQVRFQSYPSRFLADMRHRINLKMLANKKDTRMICNPFHNISVNDDLAFFDRLAERLFSRLHPKLLFSLNDLQTQFEIEKHHAKDIYICLKFVNMDKKDQMNYYQKHQNDDGIFWTFLKKMSAKYNYIRANLNSDLDMERIDRVCHENGVDLKFSLHKANAIDKMLFLMMSPHRYALFYAWAQEHHDQHLLALYRTDDRKELEKNKPSLKEL